MTVNCVGTLRPNAPLSAWIWTKHQNIRTRRRNDLTKFVYASIYNVYICAVFLFSLWIDFFIRLESILQCANNLKFVDKVFSSGFSALFSRYSIGIYLPVIISTLSFNCRTRNTEHLKQIQIHFNFLECDVYRKNMSKLIQVDLNIQWWLLAKLIKAVIVQLIISNLLRIKHYTRWKLCFFFAFWIALLTLLSNKLKVMFVSWLFQCILSVYDTYTNQLGET